jgi:dTDP-4-dehydrorhamnose reductase
MKFLIVGASSWLGGEILACAQQRGHVCLGTRHRQNVEGLHVFDLQNGRITERIDPSFFSGGGVTAVLCAAICQFDRCVREKELSRRVNVEGTLRLIADLLREGARIVFISTSAVFDGVRGGYCEDDPPAPICEYGRQKAEVEAALRRVAPEAMIVRPERLLGDTPRSNNLFTQWTEQLRTSGQIPCIAGQMFSPIGVADAARAVVLACERQLAGIYHAAGEECIGRDALARRFLALARKQGEVQSLPQSAFSFADPRPLRTCINGDKLREAVAMQYAPLDQLITSYVNRMQTLPTPDATDSRR